MRQEGTEGEDVKAALRLIYQDPVWMQVLTDRGTLLALQDAFTLVDERDPDQVETFVSVEHEAAPVGLRSQIQAWAEANRIDVGLWDWPEAAPPRSCSPTILSGLTLYPHQVVAVEAALAARRGVWEIATAGGKTACSMALYEVLGRPRTLYIVPSVAALSEIHDRYLQRLPGASIGRLGGGFRELDGGALIAVVDSVYAGIKRTDREILGWLEECQLYFLDEAHQQRAFSWQTISSSCKAPWRVAMSGTPYKDPRSRYTSSPLNASDTALRAWFGDTLCFYPAAVLQRLGRLAPCEVISVPVAADPTDGWEWHDVYRQGVVFNDARNLTLACLSANLADMGGWPLLSVIYRDHGRVLQHLLAEFGVQAICSYGGETLIIPRALQGVLPPGSTTCRPERGRHLTDWLRARYGATNGQFLEVGLSTDVQRWVGETFRAREFQVLIGSKIYDQALNIRYLTDLVNAAGTKASQRWRQKIGRTLRLFEAKTKARIWDPWDEHHPFLLKHSRERLQTVVSEGFERAEGRYPVEAYTHFRAQAHLVRRVQRTAEMDITEIEVSGSLRIPCAQGVIVEPRVSLRGRLAADEDEETAYRELSLRCVRMLLLEAQQQASWGGQVMQGGFESAVALVHGIGGTDESGEDGTQLLDDARPDGREVSVR
jgi:hypothetical protein